MPAVLLHEFVKSYAKYVLKLHFYILLLVLAIFAMPDTDYPLFSKPQTLQELGRHLGNAGEQLDSAANTIEHASIKSDVERESARVTLIEGRQIDVLSRLAKVEANLDTLRQLAERRENILWGIVAGMLGLIAKELIVGLLAAKSFMARIQSGG